MQVGRPQFTPISKIQLIEQSVIALYSVALTGLALRAATIHRVRVTSTNMTTASASVI